MLPSEALETPSGFQRGKIRRSLAHPNFGAHGPNFGRLSALGASAITKVRGVWGPRHLRCRTRSVDLVHEKTVLVHRSMRDLIAESSPAVVTIVCRDIDAKGTGFIISPGGHIVTNNHVVSLIDFPDGTLRVRYSTEIRVISNGASFGASLLTDPSEPRPVVFDYAVLKMEAPLPVTPLKLGTLADVRSGDQVVCLGYPLDFMQVVATQGIISSLVRRPSHWNSLHQMNTVLTDALVQFGHSGGPLIHVDSGLTIAINTLRHEYRSPLVDELVRWRQNRAAQEIPGLTAVIDYVLKYSQVGLNYAISLEHVQDDPQWPLRETTP